ncbi:MAG: single-stranded-DNA-specific exonuclease [Cellvibrionaceae bacterium]|jgi:single-stranded-DNA-specific exonuclease
MTPDISQNQKRWQVAPKIPDNILREAPSVNPIVAQILYNRGIATFEGMRAFMESRYIGKSDPFLLAGMAAAVERILRALDNHELVVVYGDFDADGVTSTVLVLEALWGLGFSKSLVQPYIPHRVDEGYGLNKEALTKLKLKGAALVITVDCGIRSVAEVQHGVDEGLDIIITDHHSIGPQLPTAAFAIINPKREDCPYPEKMLAGVGIAYKLAEALHSQRPTEFDPKTLLDLVAIGTVADVAPLLGENRQLVKDGLQVMNTALRPGLMALATAAKLNTPTISAMNIGFTLGPRINAAGRIGPAIDMAAVRYHNKRNLAGPAPQKDGYAYLAARLLFSRSHPQAAEYAQELNTLNSQRQQMTEGLNRKAEALVLEELEDDKQIDEVNVLFAADHGFEPGIVGLVAGRLKEKYYRPAIILEMGEEESVGSCRSIPEVHITHMLDQLSDILVRYGGHAAAAGLTIRNEHLAEFKKRITILVDAEIGKLNLTPTIPIDALIDIEQVDASLYALLQKLEPTGCANPSPVFLSRRVEVQSTRAVGKTKDHLQVTFLIDGNRILKSIGFGLGFWHENLPSFVDIVYSIDENTWNNATTLQLQIKDIKPAI